jgi:glycosyltransferase involved in cell wall biosynthesis
MKVTVVMAVHNALPHLDEALNSLFSQTLKDLAVIAVDDASTDGSAEYLHQVMDTRLRVVASNIRRGAGPARNIGIGLSNSEYIAFMDADDISLPARLERQVDYLDRNSDISAVGTLVSYCVDSGLAGFHPPLALDHDSIRSDLMAGKHAIVNATLMIRAEVLKCIGGYRVEGPGEDWDLFLRLTEAGGVANLNERLYLYRLNPASVTLNHGGVIQARIAHACDCARRRLATQEEISFEHFCAQWRGRPRLKQWLDLLDEVSAAQYRKAMAEVLNKRRVTGYARFVGAAFISPQRVLQRLRRTARCRSRPPTKSSALIAS